MPVRLLRRRWSLGPFATSRHACGNGDKVAIAFGTFPRHQPVLRCRPTTTTCIGVSLHRPAQPHRLSVDPEVSPILTLALDRPNRILTRVQCHPDGRVPATPPGTSAVPRCSFLRGLTLALKPGTGHHRDPDPGQIPQLPDRLRVAHTSHGAPNCASHAVDTALSMVRRLAGR